MAIPVANPPPPYEPPPPRAEASDPPRALGPEGRGPGGADPRVRGCMIALGIAGALGCIASLAIAVSCRGCMQMGEAQATRQITAGYRAAARGTPDEAADEADLRALEQLGDAGSLSIVSFGVLSNRFNDALANDGRIDADELHHGMELVHDIVAGNGSVPMERYPDGR